MFCQRIQMTSYPLGWICIEPGIQIPAQSTRTIQSEEENNQLSISKTFTGGNWVIQWWESRRIPHNMRAYSGLKNVCVFWTHYLHMLRTRWQPCPSWSWQTNPTSRFARTKLARRNFPRQVAMDSYTHTNQPTKPDIQARDNKTPWQSARPSWARAPENWSSCSNTVLIHLLA